MSNTLLYLSAIAALLAIFFGGLIWLSWQPDDTREDIDVPQQERLRHVDVDEAWRELKMLPHCLLTLEGELYDLTNGARIFRKEIASRDRKAHRNDKTQVPAALQYARLTIRWARRKTLLIMSRNGLASYLDFQRQVAKRLSS